MPYSSPFELILCRQQEAVMDLVDAGVFDMNECDDDHGASLLHWAIDHRCDRLAFFLVKKGCDLNGTETAEGYTPLDSAVKRGFTDLVALIMEKGGMSASDLPENQEEEEEKYD
jgi:ankyrin repeat protein